MTDSISITTNTDITAEMLGLKNGKSNVRLLMVGGSGTFYIRHSVAQGYASGGESIADGVARQFEMDTHDVFKVVFASGTCTAKKIGS